MGKVIAILSGKGGVGKTTVVVNLGVALQQLRKKVVIIEGNITSSNLGLHLGVADYPTTIHGVLKGEMNIVDAILVHPSRVHYIPGSLSVADARKVSLSKLKKKLRRIVKKYDFILIDGSPGLDDKTIHLLRASDETIIVTNPEITAIADAVKVIETAKKNKVEIRGLVLNKVKEKEYELTIEEIEATSGVPVISIIPEDLNVPKSIALGYPLMLYKPSSVAAKAFLGLAESLTGPVGEYPLRRPGIFYRLKKWLFG